MHFEIEGHRSDPTSAWEAVADTDFLNRRAGAGAVLALDMVPDGQEYPEIRGVMAGPLGTRQPFVENENHWVRGRHFYQGRRYSAGPIVSSSFRVDLAPDGDRVIPRIRLELAPSNRLLGPIVRAAMNRYRDRWQAVLNELPEDRHRERPAVRDLGPLAAGLLERWSQQVPEPVVERIRHHLVSARPLELQQMRAFSLADAWGEDRDSVVSAFLAGTRDGLFEMYWSVRCPRCKGQNAQTDQLGNLADHGTCVSCRIGYEADLSTNVEVLFAPHPSILSRAEETFCSVFPMGNPTIEASVILHPGENWDESVHMEPGPWRLVTAGQARDLEIEVSSKGSTELEWNPTIEADAHLGSGDVGLHLHNCTAGKVRVQLTRPGQNAGFVPAGYIATLPDFRRSMGHQVLAPDTRISTRSVCILFTDLTGSTAMYEDLGDATAYAVVRDHFRLLRSAAEAHGGSVVKTIGDAVMASFNDPVRALAGAVQMQRDFHQWVETTQLERRPGLTIGLHAGAALVVHTEQSGLDYFGQTVNVAARCESVADRGEIVFTEACRAWPGFAEVVADHDLETQDLERQLKGLRAPVSLHRVAVAC